MLADAAHLPFHARRALQQGGFVGLHHALAAASGFGQLFWV
ncbi:hypothetical protein [Paludibacterium denitrificans]|nr:hypothetical protein [Paludibacterium denitrificans]